MPVVRQGAAPDGNRQGGNQPAHQSMSTDVQRVRLQPCTTSSSERTTAQTGGGGKNASVPLDSGHQSDATVAPCCLAQERRDARNFSSSDGIPATSADRSSRSSSDNGSRFDTKSHND